jgi:hypothetical protein
VTSEFRGCPVEPGPITVFFKDGTTMGMESRYLGTDDDGTRNWEVTARVREEDVDHFECEILPPMTQIAIVYVPAT